MKRDEVSALLGTQNKKDQAAQIQQLIQLSNAPVLTVVITFDSRVQRVDAKQIGGEAPNEILQQILDAAKNLFNQQEIAKQVKLAQSPDKEPETPAGEELAPDEEIVDDISH